MAKQNEYLHLILNYQASIGCHEWEKKQKQKITLSLKLYYLAADFLNKDQLSAAIDYDQIDRHIQNLLNQRHYHLIENLAHKLTQSLLECFEFSKIELEISKHNAIKHATKVAFYTEKTVS